MTMVWLLDKNGTPREIDQILSNELIKLRGKVSELHRTIQSFDNAMSHRDRDDETGWRPE